MPGGHARYPRHSDSSCTGVPVKSVMLRNCAKLKGELLHRLMVSGVSSTVPGGQYSPVCKGQKWGVREAFERVRQLCAVVGMDEEEYGEIDEQGNWEGVADRLGSEERGRARSMVKEVD